MENNVGESLESKLEKLEVPIGILLGTAPVLLGSLASLCANNSQYFISGLKLGGAMVFGYTCLRILSYSNDSE